nr:hypothetical protein [uncultured Roseibium sp.]
MTLGPEGTNHDFVLRNYLRERGSRARVIHAPDAARMLEQCFRGDATHLMICAAHPAAAETVATAQYAHGILLTDTFIAASQPLAILTRSDVENPRTIALQPATRSYTSLSGFDEVIEVTSTVAAFEGLLQGDWDSALTLRRYADTRDVKMVRPVDAARDAWLVLSRG